MEQLNAIYTKVRECQDCHKCIRECPVKAIRVEAGYAKVVPELCIMCGNCVLACPSSAKQVRDDLPSVKTLLASGRKVIVSLAPSFVAQFASVRPAQLIHALKKLGFFAVSETALGAQQVSAGISMLMSSEPKQIWISSACPVVVDFIGKYHPECQPHIFGVLSPLLTHCKCCVRNMAKISRPYLSALALPRRRKPNSILNSSMQCLRSRTLTAG
jgi:iron only hydrogenase large subunit-like protein